MPNRTPRTDPPLAISKPVEHVPEVREPPLLTLFKTVRDEIQKMARDAHRLSMLVDSVIDRLEGRTAKPITVNADRVDEDPSGNG